MDAVWALTFITVGSLLLLNNFNLLPPLLWSQIWRLWPVLLILMGFQAILGKSKLAEFAIFIIGLCLLGGLIYFLWDTPSWFLPIRPESRFDFYRTL